MLTNYAYLCLQKNIYFFNTLIKMLLEKHSHLIMIQLISSIREIEW